MRKGRVEYTIFHAWEMFTVNKMHELSILNNVGYDWVHLDHLLTQALHSHSIFFILALRLGC